VRDDLVAEAAQAAVQVITTHVDYYSDPDVRIALTSGKGTSINTCQPRI